MKFKLEYQAALIATVIFGLGLYTVGGHGLVRTVEIVNVVLFMTMVGYLSVEFAFLEHEKGLTEESNE